MDTFDGLKNPIRVTPVRRYYGQITMLTWDPWRCGQRDCSDSRAGALFAQLGCDGAGPAVLLAAPPPIWTGVTCFTIGLD